MQIEGYCRMDGQRDGQIKKKYSPHSAVVSINLESYLFGSRQNCYTQGRNSEVRLGGGEACAEGLFNCLKKGGGRGEEGNPICERILMFVNYKCSIMLYNPPTLPLPYFSMARDICCVVIQLILITQSRIIQVTAI